MIGYLLYRLGNFATRTMPRGFIYRFAAFLAHCHYLIDRRARLAVLANLRRVYGETPPAGGLEPVARRVFLNFSANVVDFLRIPQLTPAEVDETIEVQGWENVEAAARGGRGVIILSAHFGNWEYGAVLLSVRGHRVSVVALDHGSERVTRLFARHRESQGVRTLPVYGSIFAIMKALRRGGMVCIVSDRELVGQGMPMRFFGEEAMMPRAPASIAIKTGAAIVPAYMLRLGHGRYRAVLAPAVEVDDLPEATRLEQLTERCIRIIEGWIRAAPDQWCVFAPIWRGAYPAAGERVDELERPGAAAATGES